MPSTKATAIALLTLLSITAASPLPETGPSVFICTGPNKSGTCTTHPLTTLSTCQVLPNPDPLTEHMTFIPSAGMICSVFTDNACSNTGAGVALGLGPREVGNEGEMFLPGRGCKVVDPYFGSTVDGFEGFTCRSA